MLLTAKPPSGLTGLVLLPPVSSKCPEKQRWNPIASIVNKTHLLMQKFCNPTAHVSKPLRPPTLPILAGSHDVKDITQACHDRCCSHRCPPNKHELKTRFLAAQSTQPGFRSIKVVTFLTLQELQLQGPLQLVILFTQASLLHFTSSPSH